MTRNEIIEHLRSGAEQLERQAKADLLIAEQMKKQADTLENGPESSTPAETPIRPSIGLEGYSEMLVKKSGRLAELREFIRVRAPVSRKKIYEESGIPNGTLNTTLNTTNFHQDSDGLWSLKE